MVFISQKMTESNDEEIDLLVQEDFNFDERSERSFFRQPSVSNSYRRELHDGSKLHIRKIDEAIRLYNTSKYLGLFHLFLPRRVLDSYRKYTNEKLSQHSPKSTTNEKEFHAYIGLELATSMVPMNEIKSYWSEKMFLGHEVFITDLYRDDRGSKI